MIYTILFILVVLTDAIGQSLRDRKTEIFPRLKSGNKLFSHTFHGLMVAVFLSGFLLANIGELGVITWGIAGVIGACYIGIRYTIFDWVYNPVAGNDFWYLGKTSIYGKFLTWLLAWTGFPKAHLLFLTRVVIGAAAIGILIFSL